MSQRYSSGWNQEREQEVGRWRGGIREVRGYREHCEELCRAGGYLPPKFLVASDL